MSSKTMKAISALIFAIIAIMVSTLSDAQWNFVENILGYEMTAKSDRTFVEGNTLDVPLQNKFEHENYVDKVDTSIVSQPPTLTTIYKYKVAYKTKYVKVPCPCEDQNDKVSMMLMAVREARRKLGMKAKDTIRIRNATTKIR